MTATVVSETIIAAPPDRVFDALTDPQQILEWWINEPYTKIIAIEMDPRPGGQWRFQWRTTEGLDYGAIGAQLRRNRKGHFEAYGRIIECVRPRLLVWSWAASWHEDPSRATTVRWELEPVGRGTRVRVTHTGLEREPIAEHDYNDGWRRVLTLVATFVERSGAISVARLAWRDDGVAELVEALDEYQIDLYGRASCHLESIETLERSDATLFGVFDASVLVGIGAVKMGSDHAELKRVYVKPAYRGRGAASALMQALEEEASKRGVKTLCLETGRRHFSALRFYERLGYARVESFGSYVPNPVSIYLRKVLP